MIEIKNVTKHFDNFKALEDVSIKVTKGTIHGLIGENGAGKTTLIQAIVGIYTTDSGSIKIDGEDVYDNNEIKSKIGYVADRNQYFKSYRISDLVSFFELTYPKFSKESFHEYNKIMKLDTRKKVKQLSKGMQMRLSLILNLSLHPEVLVLDEPTSGLDAIVKKQILDIILAEVLEKKMTVIISSHHIGELERICDEITIINHGRVARQSTLDGLKHDIKKLQVVFSQAPVELESHEEILNVENIGSVYYIVTDQYDDKFTDKLKNMGATLIETIGITLEEIFIYTSKVKKGAIENENK